MRGRGEHCEPNPGVPAGEACGAHEISRSIHPRSRAFTAEARGCGCSTQPASRHDARPDSSPSWASPPRRPWRGLSSEPRCNSARTLPSSRMGEEVAPGLGTRPGAAAPHAARGRRQAVWAGRRPMHPASTKVDAKLTYTPKKRGLLWHRTYDVEFSAHYEITNPRHRSRNVRIQLALPSKTTSYDNFAFQLGSATRHGDRAARRHGGDRGAHSRRKPRCRSRCATTRAGLTAGPTPSSPAAG